ncbi:MAG: PTS sugar transporter subunit IIC [Fusobacteriaceae bacterium]
MNFSEKIDKYLGPVAMKISGQRHVSSIKDGFISFMPFLIIGSIFIIIQDFPIQAWQDVQEKIFPGFNQFIILPKRVTYDIMSLFLSWTIAYRLAQKVNVEPLSASMLSLASFILVTPITTMIDVNGTQVEVAKVITVGGWYGTNGILVAILISVVVTELFAWFVRKKIIIKMPDQVPPAVSKSFAALIPGLCIMVLMLLIRFVFMQTTFGSIHNFILQIIGVPITSLIANNIFGAIATVIVISLLWFIGLNGGAIVNGIMRPFWIPLQEQNLKAIELKTKILPNIITEQFFDLIWIGGAGATLGVAIILAIRCRSKQLKEIGKLSVWPGFFNINEPIMFGVPVVLNPLTLFPLVLGPAAITVVNYLAMALNIVARPTGIVVPWTTPPLIQGFLVTNHWSGAALQLVDILIVILIWIPFIKIIDKNLTKNEQQK